MRAPISNDEPPRRRASRTPLLALAALSLLVACGDQAVEAAAPVRARNVVFLALDTVRPDRLGFYGNAAAHTPRLDAFARDAFVFENAQTVSPWTAPSLITVMTGLHPEVHGVLEAPVPGRLDEKVVTLAEVLRARGYETAAFTEGGYARPDFGLDQGFDTYPVHVDDAPGEYDVIDRESRLAANVDRTVEWLAERGERPFFLFFHTYEAHSPYRAPEDLVRRFEPGFDARAELARANAAIERWNTSREVDADGALAIVLARLRGPDGMTTIQGGAELVQRSKALGLGPKEALSHPAVVARVRNLYDAGLASLDRGLARLLDALDQPGVRENTLVVMFSDHGEGLGDHGEIEHGETLHESVLRIVGLLRAPWLDSAPRRIPDLVRLTDVAPTVLDLASLDVGAMPSQGRSLRPALAGGEIDLALLQHGRTVDHQHDRLFAVRTERWRLIADLESGSRQLFDVQADASELVDVGTRHPQVVEELEVHLELLRAGNAALARSLATHVEHRAIDAATRRDLHDLGYTGED